MLTIVGLSQRLMCAERYGRPNILHTTFIIGGEEMVRTPSLKVAERVAEAFDALLNRGTAISLVFFDAHVSCPCLGVDCEANCNSCRFKKSYKCVIATYIDGNIDHIMVYPYIPTAFTENDICIGSDLHRFFLPDLPEELDSNFMRKLASGSWMSLDDYDDQVRELNKYPEVATRVAKGEAEDFTDLSPEGHRESELTILLPLLALGLTGEAGEVANKVKKFVRNKTLGGRPPHLEDIVEEIGDCLWYCSALLDALEYSTEEAMVNNVSKLLVRAQLDQIATENRGEVELG